MGSGTWHRTSHHISWLEVRAVSVALQLLQFRLRGKMAVFMIDNAAMVSYLKKQRGARSLALLKVSTRVLKLAHKLQITMVPIYFAGQLNILADPVSHTGQVIPSERSLSTKSFQWIVSRSPWGPPQVDMFANSLS